MSDRPHDMLRPGGVLGLSASSREPGGWSRAELEEHVRDGHSTLTGPARDRSSESPMPARQHSCHDDGGAEAQPGDHHDRAVDRHPRLQLRGEVAVARGSIDQRIYLVVVAGQPTTKSRWRNFDAQPQPVAMRLRGHTELATAEVLTVGTSEV